jgi:site-specific DNA-methyltransferase (adenine-specific)
MTGPWNAEQLFSSKSVEWATPQEVFDALDARFDFDLDASASAGNTKCSMYLDEELDALRCDWSGPAVVREIGDDGSTWTTMALTRMRTVFLNPPWGRSIGKWIEKAYVESRKGVTVCCLLPACTDTKWWAEWVWKAAEVRFITGRLRFIRDDGHTGPSTKGACVVVFAPWSEGPPICRMGL